MKINILAKTVFLSLIVAAIAASDIIFREDTEAQGIKDIQSIKNHPDEKFLKSKAPDVPKEGSWFLWPFNLLWADFGSGQLDIYSGQHGDTASGFSKYFAYDGKDKYTIYNGTDFIENGSGRGAYLTCPTDVNDDGLIDISVSDGDTSGTILLNKGFKDGKPGFIKKEKFACPSGVAFADIDKSGTLSTFSGGLFKGAGTNSKVLSYSKAIITPGHGRALFCDFNNDGFPDLIAESTIKKRGQELKFYLNRGNSIFEDYTEKSGLQSAPIGPLAAGDINNDGIMDAIFYGDENPVKPGGNFKIFTGNKDGTFNDITQKSNITLPAKFGFENVVRHNLILADLDNDGLLDLIVANRYMIYRNTGGGVIENSGTLPWPGEGRICAGDYNNDGKMDLLALGGPKSIQIYTNVTQNDNSYIKIALKGIDKNKLAIGARLELYEPGKLGDIKYLAGIREIMSNEDDKTVWNPLHFGTGKLKEVDIRVIFPGGKVVEKKNIKTNNTIQIHDSEEGKTVEFVPGKTF